MKKYDKFDIRGNWTCNILVKPSVFVIYILPIVLSVSLGTAGMAETLSSPDRELTFLQFVDPQVHLCLLLLICQWIRIDI